MDGIDKTNWKAISAALDELLEADGSQRDVCLAQLQRDNPALAGQLQALLAQRPAIEVEHFLEGSAVDPVAFGALEGRSFGRYTLERPLGQDGMGSVWLGRCDAGRNGGRAAVRLLNPDLLGANGAERLRHDADALTRLEHPNIARLTDAGVVAGQPYLVLEYVEGEPIDRWCDGRRLDIAARIHLFTQVLAAVAHAHRQLILHCDLKSSNILVSADGCVKLLDFGIARLLESNGQGAPEQLERAEVTTATDIYALGRLLHLLLVGTQPTPGAVSAPLDQQHALIAGEPMRLSEAALNMDAELAQARRSSHRQLQRGLRGDLDNIVAKTLKKMPAERYASVDAFCSDLRHYLNHGPVSECADPLGYRLGKLLRRLLHR